MSGDARESGAATAGGGEQHQFPLLPGGDAGAPTSASRSRTSSAAHTPLPHKVKRVLVCGSRGWKDEERVYEVLSELAQRDEIEILHGGAEGADSAALWAGLDLGITAYSYLPDYKTHGKVAPHVRNDKMLDCADLVVAFWDGESRGTKSVIDKAHKRSIPVEVIRG